MLTALARGVRTPEFKSGSVVVDCCPLLGVLSLNAIFACDLLIVPVSADYLALQGAHRWNEHYAHSNRCSGDRLPRRYVLTRFDARSKMSSEVADLMAMAFRPDEICVTPDRGKRQPRREPCAPTRCFSPCTAKPGAHDYQVLIDELVERRIYCVAAIARRGDGDGTTADDADDAFDIE